MDVGLSNIKIKDEFDRIQVFFILHTSLFVFAKFYYFLSYNLSFANLFIVFLWLVYSRFFFRTLKNLHYSYWTFLGVSILVLVTDIYESLMMNNDLTLFYFFFFSLVFLLIASYLLRTPLFYPVVSWWEYDFRYRNDIKVTVSFDDKEEIGRIVDIRGDAGGVSLFDDISVGKRINITPKYNDISCTYEVEIVSKRQHSIGRPYVYGVRFLFKSEEERSSFSKLQKYWQFERKYKQQAKLLVNSNDDSK